ncbi:substrate-binding periplasmic protein, partial [Escherichia coli]|uniref:substrate-binding periplasmic protein n=1 Tax=Escherichia coli TaxID=562 RepID=UPI001BDB7A63
IVRLLLGTAGVEYDITIYPWARAIALARTQVNTCVFSMSRTPEREARFQWLVPLMVVRYGLYTLATRAPLSLDELRPLRVGLLRGSPIGAHLKAEGFQSLLSAKDYKDLLR